MYNNMDYHDNDSSVGYVRILHAVPDAPNVDVYANDTLIAQNLAYGNYTDYSSLPEGTYKIALYVTGTEEPVLANMLMVHPNSMFTISAIGLVNNMEFLGVSDAAHIGNPDNAMIRFLHLSPDAPAVDITLPDGSVIFSEVSFKELTPYLIVSPGSYTVEVRVSGTDTTVLSVPDLNLEPGMIYTVYAIGLVNEAPDLEALVVPDGM